MKMLKIFFRPIYIPLFNWYYKKYKSPKRYHHLYDEIEKNKAKTLLEIGTWNGNQAVKMIQVAQNCTGSPVQYVGFDLFEELTEEMYHRELSKRPPTKKEVQDKLSVTNADVILIQGNTTETLPTFTKEEKTFDFIFIDGGHDVDTIQSDWNEVSKLMHKNTVVIFDDYWRNRPEQSAKPVVDQIDRQKYSVEILPEIDVFNNPDFGHLEISFAKITKKSTV